MVFGWNDAGLGQSRAAGFSPGPAFRWARPEPAPDGRDRHAGRPGLDARTDADAAWRYWTHSDARTALDGLALDGEVAWALAELTRDRFERLARRPIAVVGDRTRGTAVRVGTRERDGRTVVDYAAVAWADADAARVLFDAIRADAAGADATRVLLPGTTRYVSDAAMARAPLSGQSDYVFTDDLTGTDGS
jgi:hypothetical protein